MVFEFSWDKNQNRRHKGWIKMGHTFPQTHPDIVGSRLCRWGPYKPNHRRGRQLCCILDRYSNRLRSGCRRVSLVAEGLLTNAIDRYQVKLDELLQVPPHISRCLARQQSLHRLRPSVPLLEVRVLLRNKLMISCLELFSRYPLLPHEF